MANYNLVIDSTFQPFSFERYLQPYQIYGQEYKAQEAALADLETKANVWDNMADEANDPETYKQYKRYADDLRTQATVLSKEGLNVSSRQALNTLRKRYAAEITPIENAYNKREADIKRQQAAYDRDKSIVFSRDASTTSLDEYLKGNVSSYNQWSKDDYYKKGSEIALAASARERKVPSSTLGGQYYEIKQGYSKDEVANWLANPESNPELTSLLNELVESSGAEGANKEAITQASLSGMLKGLTQDTKYQANRDFTTSLQNRQMALQEEQLNFQKDKLKKRKIYVKDKEGNVADSGYYYDPTINMKVDKEGNIIGGTSGNPYKIPTGEEKDKNANKKIDESGNPTKLAFREVSSVEGMQKLGYTPVFATQLHHEVGGHRVWTSGREGEDVPHVLNDWKTGATTMDESGDFTFNPKDFRYKNAPMSIMTDEAFANLDEDIQREIARQARAIGIGEDEDFKVMRVGRKDGKSYDYIIFRNNDYL